MYKDSSWILETWQIKKQLHNYTKVKIHQTFQSFISSKPLLLVPKALACSRAATQIFRWIDSTCGNLEDSRSTDKLDARLQTEKTEPLNL